MWKAITYVSSGLTLVAFIVAVAAWVYRSKILESERIIRLTPDADRARLVENTLEFFSVDTTALKRDQKYDLALQQISARAARFRTTAIVVVVVACLAAGIAVLALWKSPDDKQQIISPGSAPSSPSPEETSYLRGQVDDGQGKGLQEVTVKIDEITGRPSQVLTGS